VTGTPTGGSFTLTFGANTTAAIPFNATAAQVQAALVAIASIGTGGVICTGGPLPGTPVDVRFSGSHAMTDVALMAHSDPFTGGSSPAASVPTTVTFVAATDTFTLQPNMSFRWSTSEGYFPLPFTADVTRFNISCVNSSRFQGYILS